MVGWWPQFLCCCRHNPEDPELLSTLGLLYLQVTGRMAFGGIICLLIYIIFIFKFQTNSTEKAFECLGSALTYDPGNGKVIGEGRCASFDAHFHSRQFSLPEQWCSNMGTLTWLWASIRWLHATLQSLRSCGITLGCATMGRRNT